MQRINIASLSILLMGIGAVSAFSTSNEAQAQATTAIARAALPRGDVRDFGQPPPPVTDALSKDLQLAVDNAFGKVGNGIWGDEQVEALEDIGASGDARLAWLVLDLMRFVGSPAMSKQFTSVLNQLLNTQLDPVNAWNDATNRLIAWDTPEPPDYLKYKRGIFTTVLPAWSPLFTAGDIDWRHVSWGGVGMDERPFGTTDDPCNCIPAADNPDVTDARDAKWLNDDAIVFGIGINGEYRAYPRQIMEVREMINDTLGGRDLGIPYCTLCGAAQAWFTDDVPEGVARPVLRTTGLLTRSNKVMFDLNTYTVFDTFRGTAVAGPLAERQVQLASASIVTTTWGSWKASHPETTVLTEALAMGRNFDFRNGRDAKGPIFPIGDVDPRLAVQEDVLGVITSSGKPLAFHVPSLITALDAGQTVMIENVEVILDGGGVRAVDADGKDLGTHQAFWFAWSQFYPGTRLWPE